MAESHEHDTQDDGDFEVNEDILRVGLAQVAPIWLDRDATLEKVIECIEQAAERGVELLAFGEALVPGYPFWVERTDGARFNSDLQKELYALYLDQGVQPERGDLQGVCEAAAKHEVAVVLGIMEAAANRGGHSLYASAVYIDPDGDIGSVHRKLMPTYEERLVWATGDGHGLRVHDLPPFTVGALNCWENWMPLSRAALSAQGEDLHVAIWPGSSRLTHDITRFAAREGRSYVLSVGGLMMRDDVPDDLPGRDLILADENEIWADGGSCIAGPDGEWIVEPQSGEETLIVADLDHTFVRKERHNFDPVGHYSRPDVTQLLLDRRRQQSIEIYDEGDE